MIFVSKHKIHQTCRFKMKVRSMKFPRVNNVKKKNVANYLVTFLAVLCEKCEKNKEDYIY